MAGSLVASGASFAAGLRSEALNTYRRQYDSRQEFVGKMLKEVPSDKRVEKYFFWNSACHAVRLPRGEAYRHKAFSGIQFSAENFEFGRAIDWRRIDREDDLTSSLVERARDLGDSIGLLNERIAFQIITGAADNDLLASIPNAPDGRAIYHANDVASGNRFGVSGGNMEGDGTTTAGAAGGTATSAAITTDYYDVRSRFTRMQDTEGQPLFNPSITDGEALVVYPAAKIQAFQEAFIRERVVDGSATPTNVVQEAGLAPTLWTTQRLTGNDWFVFLTGSEHRSLGVQNREGIRTVTATWENSDLSRETGQESIRFECRRGFFVFTPYTTCQVNNAPGT